MKEIEIVYPSTTCLHPAPTLVLSPIIIHSRELKRNPYSLAFYTPYKIPNLYPVL